MSFQLGGTGSDGESEAVAQAVQLPVNDQQTRQLAVAGVSEVWQRSARIGHGEFEEASHRLHRNSWQHTHTHKIEKI